MIRVLIAEDHGVVREGLAALIDAEPGMEVAGLARNGVEAVAEVHRLQPDVVLMDLVMPHIDGVEAIAQIVAADLSTKILVLTSFTEDDKALRAIRAGATGFLPKDSSSEELCNTIRDVHLGKLSIHSSISLRVLQQLRNPASSRDSETLSEREIDVLRLIARGLTNREIADTIAVTERTVTTHVTNILTKLQLTNRTQLAVYAVKEGLLDM
jgi:two-component system, NarL family, response regulator LiaR